MYRTILLTLDASPTDRPIIDHVKTLAATLGSRVVLLHVATGVQAQWHGAEAGGREVAEDREYLRAVETELRSAGIPAESQLAFGEPAREIVRWVRDHGCDLVAMSTHG